MSGLTAAIEAAEVGYEVVIVEKNAYLGGRVAQLYQYFPKLCPQLRTGNQLQADQTTPGSQSIPWRKWNRLPDRRAITR